MARSKLAGLALSACLFFSAGCGHEARVGARNVEEAGKFLAMQGPDDLTRSIGRAIAMQAGATADQMDLMLWGLMARHTEASVTAQDWAESPKAAERKSEGQARRIEAETAQIQAISGSIFESLGLATSLTGSGFLGLAMAWALKNQSTIKSLVSYAKDMKEAETDDDVKKVEEAHPVAKNVVAKSSVQGKVL